MLIEQGCYDPWPGFALEIAAPLLFQPGSSNFLCGPNGSGKSSFITQILLPRLLDERGLYLLYFEQQPQLQLQTLKAYASLIPPHREIRNARDATGYLLDDLYRAQLKDPRPAYLVADESMFLEDIHAYLSSLEAPWCLIFSSHSRVIPYERQVIFEPLSGSRSKVYASPA